MSAPWWHPESDPLGDLRDALALGHIRDDRADRKIIQEWLDRSDDNARNGQTIGPDQTMRVSRLDDDEVDWHPAHLPRWWRVHNLVAHPLLILWPRVGRWLHDRTAP